MQTRVEHLLHQERVPVGELPDAANERCIRRFPARIHEVADLISHQAR